MKHDIWIYLLVMSAVTLAIRILPLTLIRRQIRSRFLRSFLFYVPYVTLAVMTFPDIIRATQSPAAGGLALIVGALLAWFGASLFKVAAACCVVVFLAEQLLL
ncbi:MAG: AzlD domain-containing protein [Oscillospiraceae bacterium]|nr:AzlD domain-containing protein [Oscillospiraceae bacterium]